MKQILRLSLATIFWAALSAPVPIWKDGGTVLPVAYAQAVTIKFAPPTNYPVSVAPFNVATGDFNGDGKQDLAVANSGNGTVSILLGNGDGTFQQAMNFTVGSPLNRVAVGDFNGDGKPDLAVGNGSANTVSILLGKGDGTFELPVRHNTGISADYIAVADFNNDKNSDLLVSTIPVGELYQGGISVLLSNGDGSFQSPKVTTVTSFEGPTPYVAIGDFNGDGRLDVATGNATVNYSGTKGNVIILLGNGDGTFQAPVTSPTSFQPVYLTTGISTETEKPTWPSWRDSSG